MGLIIFVGLSLFGPVIFDSDKLSRFVGSNSFGPLILDSDGLILLATLDLAVLDSEVVGEPSRNNVCCNEERGGLIWFSWAVVPVLLQSLLSFNKCSHD